MSARRRPSREQLRARLALMKRGVVILAAGSFGAIALLAAGRTASNAQRATPVQQAQTQHQGTGDDQGDDGYFSYVPSQSTGGGGTLGGGSAGSPPVAGTHAS